MEKMEDETLLLVFRGCVPDDGGGMTATMGLVVGCCLAILPVSPPASIDLVGVLVSLGGKAISRGRLVNTNSLLNDSVMMLANVFSNMFSIRPPNRGDLFLYDYIFYRCV